jgi:hypothetical protein
LCIVPKGWNINVGQIKETTCEMGIGKAKEKQMLNNLTD